MSWAIVYSIDQQLGLNIFGLSIFTIIASFLCNYIIGETTANRRITALGTTLVAMLAAMGLIVILDRNTLLTVIIIVSVFFLAYYARKFSLGLHALGFMAVASSYFSWVFDVNSGDFGLFFLAIIVAALSNLLFWSVLMPPRPINAIRRAISSYYLRSAVMLSNLGSDLENRGSPKKNETFEAATSAFRTVHADDRGHLARGLGQKRSVGSVRGYQDDPSLRFESRSSHLQ